MCFGRQNGLDFLASILMVFLAKNLYYYFLKTVFIKF